MENWINLGMDMVCSKPVQKFLNRLFGVNPEDFNLGFKKKGGDWYSDIKHWPKAYEANQLMVRGADDLLELLSKGHDYITLNVKTSAPQDAGYICLDKIDEDSMGGTYRLCNYPEFDRTVWLCNVTKFVMGQHPRNIWFKVKGYNPE